MRETTPASRAFSTAASCILLGLASMAGAAIPATERAALIALYESTNGPGWSYRGHWRNAQDTDYAPPGTECTWFGVFCDLAWNHVTDVSFWNNNLSGPIPPEIGSLASLKTLSIFYNKLTGSMPREIGNLSNLTTLLLSDNQLTGPIPPEIGRLSHLEDLVLASNQLSGSIPAQIGDLSSATNILLQYNRLSGPIPREIGNLHGLVDALSLRANELTGPVPADVFHPGLRWLDLGENHLSGEIPSEIVDLRDPTRIALDHNQLVGPIPPEIGSIGHVEQLHLESNRLSGPIPSGIGGLRDVSGLFLDHNQLTGPIPPDIGKLGEVEELHLEHNRLSGPIPPELARLRIQGRDVGGTLRLDHNRLRGPIPRELGALFVGASWLRNVIHLEENRLTGRIPAELGDIANLGGLYLQGNRLEGPIPTDLAKLTSLDPGELDLSWNALYTSDATLRTFLDAKAGAGWELTQTVAPTGLVAGAGALDGIPLSWSPIAYTGDAGGYRLWYGTRAGGPYNLAGTTADKTSAAGTVGGLSPGTTHYFVLDTVTEPHADNPSTVVSERTAEVSATTPAGGAGWLTLTVVTDGPGSVFSRRGWIDCGGACSGTFAPGTPLTLTAAAEAGWSFLGWGGACTGTEAACDLTMDAARTVTASFGPLPPTSYYTVTPCRAFDSREGGASGALVAGAHVVVAVAGHCHVPATATAVSLNVTVVSPTASGHLRLYASGAPRPGTSAVSYSAGPTRANNAVASLGADGALVVYAHQPNGSVHLVVDVTGYFQ